MDRRGLRVSVKAFTKAVNVDNTEYTSKEIGI